MSDFKAAAFEVFWRPRTGDGFLRCEHGHATRKDAWPCFRRIAKSLYSGAMGKFESRRDMYIGEVCTRHDGVVVGIGPTAEGYDGLPIWQD